MNHSPCADVPSEPHPMISHTINITPYQYNHATSCDVATPQTTSLSYQIIPPQSGRSPCIFQRLRPSAAQFLPLHHPASYRDLQVPLYLLESWHWVNTHRMSVYRIHDYFKHPVEQSTCKTNWKHSSGLCCSSTTVTYLAAASAEEGVQLLGSHL